MSTLTWLHLSDLHLDGKENAVHRAAFKKMIADIKRRRETESLDVDVVFFTGDLAKEGKREEYDQAGQWLDEVLDACGLAKQRARLFIVPGNHDVYRWEVERAKYRRSLHDDLAKGYLNPNLDYELINDFLCRTPNEDREVVFAKFQNFARFIADYFSDAEIRFDHNRYYFVRHIQKSDKIVVVLGLNSSWLSFRGEEQGRLLLGEIQVCNALEEARNKWPGACLHMALMHHPLYWLAEHDLHRVQQHLLGGCDLLLRGHLHCPSLTIQRTPDSHLLEFASGASLNSDCHYHAYSLAILDLATGEGRAIVRLHHQDIGGEWGADNFTYRNSRDGKVDFFVTLRGGPKAEEA